MPPIMNIRIGIPIPKLMTMMTIVEKVSSGGYPCPNATVL